MKGDAEFTAGAPSPPSDVVRARVRPRRWPDRRAFPVGVIEFRLEHARVTARVRTARREPVAGHAANVAMTLGAVFVICSALAAVAFTTSPYARFRFWNIDVSTLAILAACALVAISLDEISRLVSIALTELPIRFERGAVVKLPRGAVRAVRWTHASPTVVVELCWPLELPIRLALKVARPEDRERLLLIVAAVNVTHYIAPAPDATQLLETRPRWLPARLAGPAYRRAVESPVIASLSRWRARLPYRATPYHSPLRPLASRLLPTRNRWSPIRARRRR